jgi:hypothetical protein
MVKRRVKIVCFQWLHATAADGTRTIRSATPADGVVEMPESEAARGDALGYLAVVDDPAPEPVKASTPRKPRSK